MHTWMGRYKVHKFKAFERVKKYNFDCCTYYLPQDSTVESNQIIIQCSQIKVLDQPRKNPKSTAYMYHKNHIKDSLSLTGATSSKQVWNPYNLDVALFQSVCTFAHNDHISLDWGFWKMLFFLYLNQAVLNSKKKTLTQVIMKENSASSIGGR